MKAITFVTGNKNKLAEVSLILKGAPFEITSNSLDLPELQAKDTKTIAIQKCNIAVGLIQGPVITEDTSLCFNALNSLPGPYIKWFLEKVGLDGLNHMLDGFPSNDKTAYALCTVAYCEGPGKEVHIFEGRTEGTIVKPRGSLNFGWDPIFEPCNSKLTYAEMEKADKNAISHRYRAFTKLKEFLEKE